MAHLLPALALLLALPAVPQPAAAPDGFFAGLDQFGASAYDQQTVSVHDEAGRAALAASAGQPGLVSRLDTLEERIFFYGRPGLYSPAAVRLVEAQLSGPEWTCLERSHSPVYSLDLCVRDAGGGMRELRIIVASTQQLTFLEARGRLSLAELRELSLLASPAAERKDR